MFDALRNRRSDTRYNNSAKIDMTHLDELGIKSAMPEELLRPVPDMRALRERKKGYGDVPIDTSSPLFTEAIVDIAAYGIAGQAYYSRPNATTGDAVPEVQKTLFLRESVAKTLAAINAALSQPAITHFFGNGVELYVEDALRPVSLQLHLHDEVIPKLLRKQYPKATDNELSERLQDIIAMPSTDPGKPSPHATGGAFDITLRYKQTTPLFVADSAIPLGHKDGEMSERINPDYFEYTEVKTEDDKLARRNRRAYYAILTGAAFGMSTGFMNNPTEWWHWGRGDQLSTRIQGSGPAYYSFPDAA
jgi:D-alanyl-D-alanine dipeptidase